MYPDDWQHYDGVGPTKAELIRDTYETPADYIEFCKEKHDGLPTYATLEAPLLDEIDGIGRDLSLSIVNQMAREVT